MKLNKDAVRILKSAVKKRDFLNSRKAHNLDLDFFFLLLQQNMFIYNHFYRFKFIVHIVFL